MTVGQMAEILGYPVLTGEESLNREITSVYCCDLLSFVMGRAPADSAWITVMGNVNAIAVALLADVACIVLAEGAALDSEAQSRAQQKEIVVLQSSQPIYETATAIAKVCSL